jgi:hypothetical protein
VNGSISTRLTPPPLVHGIEVPEIPYNGNGIVGEVRQFGTTGRPDTSLTEVSATGRGEKVLRAI